MARYTAITIIYNPKATGSGKYLAESLRKDLLKRLPKQKIELMPTKYRGNAEELAYAAAKASKNPLIISASGDGGYHEVVNGVLRAQTEGAIAAAGLLPAGNANDHYRNVHADDVAKAIAESKEQQIDVLKLATSIKGKPFERYAHSYIGFGLTAKIGRNLNEIKGKKLKETWTVARTLFSARPSELVLNGSATQVHSLIISNVKTMAKYFKVSNISKSDDGKFEVSVFGSRSRVLLAGAVLKRMTVGRKVAEQVTEFSLKTVEPTLVQLDGEVLTIDAKVSATISMEPHTLRCIV